MKCYLTCALLIVTTLVTSAVTSFALLAAGDSAVITMRAGTHPDYMRIVIEGPQSIITTAKVDQSEGSITVRFPDMNFKLKEAKLPVSYEVTDEAILFSLKENRSIKYFLLTDPDRFVLDIYKNEEKSDGAQKKTEAQKSLKKIKNKEAVTNKTKNSSGDKKSDSRNKTEEKRVDDLDFVTDEFKKLWALLETGNAFGVLAVLPEYRPDDVKSLAIYHYMYGVASDTAKKYLDAVKHLRLSYIYAENVTLKEKSLIKRADAYLKMGLYHEARADYIVFIDAFPSSENINNAYFGLARSLANLDLYDESIEYYDKAGNTAEVLFNKANVLQRIEKSDRAREIYEKALQADESYPASSPETYYLIGENLRMLGRHGEARKHLSKITFGPYKDYASMSLGLIALDEANITEAVRNFTAASHSKDRIVRAKTLFNLSLAHLKANNIEDSIASLERIRHEHVDSELYKDTLLALSKLYKKEGNTNKSLSLLKELVYGKQPPIQAFDELERIILKTGGVSDKSPEVDMSVADMWKEVGQWLIDEKREDFLVQVADKLRNEGMPFLELCTWLVTNASKEARTRGALHLADYYVGIGNYDLAQTYNVIAKNTEKTIDDVLRIEAKILHAKKDNESALNNLMRMEKLNKKDIHLLGNIVASIEDIPLSELGEKAIAFYEKVLADSEWEAAEYSQFADILYSRGDRQKALKYYRIANAKNPDDEWVLYRIGRQTSRDESEELLSRLEQRNSLVSRMARSEMIANNIIYKFNEVY